MAILSAAELQERASSLNDVGTAELDRMVVEFTEIAQNYRGCLFEDLGQDPDVFPGVPYTTAPETLKRACAVYVEAVANATRSGTSRDVIAQSMDGSWTRFSTPDWSAGRPSGWTEVDRLLNSLPDYRIPGIG